MRRIVPELNNIDLDDFQFKIEKEAVKFEDKFIELLKPEDSVLHMPVFDFEQN